VEGKLPNSESTNLHHSVATAYILFAFSCDEADRFKIDCVIVVVVVVVVFVVVAAVVTNAFIFQNCPLYINI